MGTPHPSDKERRAIQRHADAGDDSAKNYLKLLDACIQVLNGSDGISLARGMMGEHDDTYGEAIDDALSEIMPVIFEISAGGWEGLRFYVPVELEKQKPIVSQEPEGSYKADTSRRRSWSGR